MTARKKGPAQPIMRECSHCNGDGEEEVCCEDCGEILFEDNIAEPHRDEICLDCAKQRAEDEASEQAGKAGGGT